MSYKQKYEQGRVLMNNELKIKNRAQTSKSNIRPDLLHALIDNADHSITVAEREGEDTILLYVNKAFEEMTGYTSEECLYQDCRFLQKDDKQPQQSKKIHRALESDTSVRVVLRNYKKDGTLFRNELTISPYFDEVESVMYYIGVQKNLGSTNSSKVVVS